MNSGEEALKPKSYRVRYIIRTDQLQYIQERKRNAKNKPSEQKVFIGVVLLVSSSCSLLVLPRGSGGKVTLKKEKKNQVPSSHHQRRHGSLTASPTLSWIMEPRAIIRAWIQSLTNSILDSTIIQVK
jgi:hypothetical protein